MLLPFLCYWIYCYKLFVCYLNAIILWLCFNNKLYAFSKNWNFYCRTSILYGLFFDFGFLSIIIASISFILFINLSIYTNLLAIVFTKLSLSTFFNGIFVIAWAFFLIIFILLSNYCLYNCSRDCRQLIFSIYYSFYYFKFIMHSLSSILVSLNSLFSCRKILFFYFKFWHYFVLFW